MLTESELLRYSRQLLLEEVGQAGQQALKRSKVLIIGMGGLGSPAAMYLAAAGVGTLVLSDFDCLEVSDLQRQIGYQIRDIGGQKVALMLAYRSQLLAPIGTMQTLEAIRPTSGVKNKLKLFDGKTLDWQTFTIAKDPQCTICGEG